VQLVQFSGFGIKHQKHLATLLAYEKDKTQNGRKT
jgi:hypothetical protein